jgi:plasmid stabilization system protein ParE
MTKIRFSPRVGEDLKRFVDHFDRFEIVDAEERLNEIRLALQILLHSPLIGRPVKSAMRELVIGQGSRGYVALYQYNRYEDVVRVVAIRSQREDGYKH